MCKETQIHTHILGEQTIHKEAQVTHLPPCFLVAPKSLYSTCPTTSNSFSPLTSLTRFKQTIKKNPKCHTLHPLLKVFVSEKNKKKK